MVVFQSGVALGLLSSLPGTTAVGIWYSSSVAFNVALKRLLRQATLYVEATAAEMLFGALSLALLGAVAVARPTIRGTLCPPPSELALLNAIAFAHVVGNLCTNYGVQHLNVAFVHTVKSSEPLFALALSRAAGVGTIPARPRVVGSLLLIVAGVAITAASQAELHTTAFLVSIGSCLGFQVRNVLTKRLGVKGGGPGAPLALLGWMSFFGVAQMGLLFLAHQLVAAATETPTYTERLLVHPWPEPILRGLVSSSSLHWLYNAASIAVLYTTTPVTHSVINSLKRVCIIVLSTVALGDRLSLTNGVGILCALVGAASYSFAKRSAVAPPEAKEALLPSIQSSK